MLKQQDSMRTSMNYLTPKCGVSCFFAHAYSLSSGIMLHRRTPAFHRRVFWLYHYSPLFFNRSGRFAYSLKENSYISTLWVVTYSLVFQ